MEKLLLIFTHWLKLYFWQPLSKVNKHVALFLGFFFLISVSNAQTAGTLVTQQGGTWYPIMQGQNFDYIDDQQAVGIKDLDLVGDTSNPLLISKGIQAYTYTSSNTTDVALNNIYYFRARIGTVDNKLGQVRVYLSFDINGDYISDIFVEVNYSDYKVYFHKADPSVDGLTPNTTSWDMNSWDPSAEYGGGNDTSNTYVGQHLVFTEYATNDDLDNDGKTDSWLEFAFSENVFADYARIFLNSEIDGSSSLALFMFTSSSNSNNPNGDIAGVDDTVTSELSTTWEDLGVVAESSLDSFSNGTFTIPGFTLEQTDLSTLVNESGTTDVFTVKLNVAPANDVIINVGVSDTTEVGVSSTSLTFSTLNWDTAQTITVTGVDDALVDGDIESLIWLSVDASSDASFQEVTSQTVTVTTQDDDVPQLLYGPLLLQVNESGTLSDSFYLMLDTQPLTPVTVNLTLTDDTEVSLGSVSSLVFNSSNWNVSQTVRVFGVDDFIDDGDVQSSIKLSIDASSDSTYLSTSTQTINVITQDDDVAAFSTSTSTLSVIENGSLTSFSVVLATEPVDPVVIEIKILDVSEVIVGISTLTFDSSNWNFPQSVTVTPVDDSLVDGAQLTDIQVKINSSSDAAYLSLPTRLVSVTTEDDDIPELLLSQTSLTVNESGSTATFEVVLNFQPSYDVAISVISSDTSEVTVSPASFNFTSLNWNVSRTITVTGVDDALFDNNQTVSVTVSVISSLDTAFANMAPKTVSVVNEDNDIPGISLSRSSVSVTELGSVATVEVSLNTKPLSDVLLELTASDLGEATVLPQYVTFTTSNWSSPQLISITGVNDNLDDGDQMSLISVEVTSDSDASYTSVATKTISVITQDDDTVGYTLSTSQLSVSETGTSQSFTVVLNSEPTAEVVFTVSSSDLSESSVSSGTITFDPSNWNSPQTIVVSGEDDSFVDGTVTSTISVIPNSTDVAYNTLAPRSVLVLTTDNDVAGFTITQTDGTTTVNEPSSTDTIAVVLNAQPIEEVILILTVSDSSELSLETSTLTFTTANWDQAQSVLVRAVDELLVDGTIVSQLNVAVDSSSDSSFVDVFAQNIDVTTTDNDVASYLVSTPAITVSESGTEANFSVVLSTQPLSPVVFNITGIDASEFSTNQTQLTFDTDSWNTPQELTVTGLHDWIDDGDQTTSLAIRVDTSSDAAFRAMPVQNVQVTTLDIDTVGFSLSSNAFTLGEASNTTSFTVVLNSKPESNVTIGLNASDYTEISLSSTLIEFTPSNWNIPQSITISPVNDAIVDGSQDSIIEVGVDATADSSYALVENQNITVTVLDDDQAGILVSNTNVTVSEDLTKINLSLALSSEPVEDVRIDFDLTDTSEASIGVSQMTFTAQNWNVSQTLIVKGKDDTILDGDQISSLTMSLTTLDVIYAAINPSAVTITTLDNDLASIDVSQQEVLVSESGSTASFNVVLGVQPLNDVRIALSSSNILEATLSPSTLLFSPSTWNVAQSVVVTGIDDVLDDGDQISVITLAVDASSDAAFLSLESQTVSVTTQDNDTNGFTVNQSDGNTTVYEYGSSDTFEVVLNAQPTSDVVLVISGEDNSEFLLSATTLTFTNSSWNTPQLITVTSVDDLDADGNVNTAVVLSVDSSSDSDYLAVVSQTITVLSIDNDTPGYTLVESSGSTLVNESGVTDSFTLVLNVAPTSEVFFSIQNSNPTQASVTPTTLTFTSINWNIPQTVLVSAIDDSFVDGTLSSNLTVSIDSNSDSAYVSLASTIVEVSVVDDDQAGILFSPTNVSVEESGTSTTVDVVLTAQPTDPVFLDLTSSDASEVSYLPLTTSFDALNWNVSQTLTLTGVDDLVQDGDQLSQVDLVVNSSSDATFIGLAIQTIQVTTLDDDVAGFTVSESTITVNESGPAQTFSVVLTTEPVTDVRINLSLSNVQEATIDQASLLFTPSNWNVSQTIRVTATDDAVDDGDKSLLLTLAIDDLSDATYVQLDPQSISVTTIDNDQAAVQISINTIEVSEAGSTATFDVVLTSQPLSDVVVELLSSDKTEGKLGVTQLTFTSLNWNVPQGVVVSGVDDSIDDGDQAFVITISVNERSNAVYAALDDQTIDGVNKDNDQSGFEIVHDGLVVSETGISDSFTVVLLSEPINEVVIDFTALDPTEVSLDQTEITFNHLNWNSPQTITVNGVDDFIDDGAVDSWIELKVNSNSDSTYTALSSQTISVTTQDDDIAGLVLSTNQLSIIENDRIDFTVQLATQPLDDVSVALQSTDESESTISQVQLIFTTSNWNNPQTVQLIGVDDTIDDGDISSAITLSTSASSDTTYASLNSSTLSVITIDDDTSAVLLSKNSLTVGETSGTDPFEIVLSSEPTSDVLIDLTVLDASEVQSDVSSVVFTPSNWNIPQEITLSGVDDFLVDGDQRSELVLTVNASSDPIYASLTSLTVEVLTIDDDVAEIQISKNNITVEESGTTDTFDIQLNSQPINEVIIDMTVTDASEALLSVFTLTFNSVNWNIPQTIVVSGVDDFIDDGTILSEIHISVNATSDVTYQSLNDQIIQVKTLDNDTVGYTIVESDDYTRVNESGTTDSFTVVLNTMPTADVTLSMEALDQSEIAIDKPSLTFTVLNWNEPQTITITGVDDFNLDKNVISEVVISVSSTLDNIYAGLADQMLYVTTIDDDIPNFTVFHTNGNTQVEESGTTDQFSVELNVIPLSDVVIEVNIGSTDEFTVDVTTLTFTPSNWNTPQYVTVTGLDDNFVDGTITSAVNLSVSANSDVNFLDVLPKEVEVTSLDDDVPVITLSGTELLTSESGITDVFSVVLEAGPTEDVVLLINVSQANQIGVSSTTLTFTPANWNVPQTIDVHAVDDDYIDGTVQSSISVVVDPSSNQAFSALPTQYITVSALDNDVAGLTLTRSELLVNESGTTDVFYVYLEARPYTKVYVDFSLTDPTEVRIDRPRVVLDAYNWNAGILVTVTGVNDDIIDGSIVSQLHASINSNSDTGFTSLAPQTIKITTEDDVDLDLDRDGVIDSQEIIDNTDPIDICSFVFDNQSVAENYAIWAAMDCDGDGILNGDEPVGDLDGDGLLNIFDTDDDNDGVLTILDPFPYDSKEWEDVDVDGIGDNSDPDMYNDGFNDDEDLISELITPFSETSESHWIISNVNIYDGIQVKVYNSFGDLVFESEDYHNQWTGKDKNTGEYLDAGSYHYIVHFSESQKTFKGWLFIAY